MAEGGEDSYPHFKFWLAEQAERGVELTAREYAFLAFSYTPTLAAETDQDHPGATETIAGMWYYDKTKAKHYLDKAIQMAPDDYLVASVASSYYYSIGQLYTHEHDGETNWVYNELENEWDKRFVEFASRDDPNDERVQRVKNEIERYEEEVRPFGVGALTSAKTAPDLLEADKKPYTSVTKMVIQAVIPAGGFDPSNPESLLFYGSIFLIALVAIYIGTFEVIKKRRKNKARRKLKG
jgi:hypothetical protein